MGAAKDVTTSCRNAKNTFVVHNPQLVTDLMEFATELIPLLLRKQGDSSSSRQGAAQDSCITIWNAAQLKQHGGKNDVNSAKHFGSLMNQLIGLIDAMGIASAKVQLQLKQQE
jgi:hypothetical protein